MKASLIFICFLFAGVLQAQKEYFKNQTLYCWAKGGINLRKFPTKYSEKITNIPFKTSVTVIDSIKGDPYIDTLKKTPVPIIINGNWIKVKYGDNIGYVFDGYLSKLKPQNLFEFFDGIKPKIDTLKFGLKETFNRKDGAYYNYIAEDGCFDHIYFIPNISFEEAVLL